MKITIAKSRRTAGILLVECVVYIALFAILTGIGTAAFYLCWDQSQAYIDATDDITAALRAGERWRADVRGATGKVSIENTPAGELLRIPRGKDQVFYSYHNGAIRRKLASANSPEMLFAKVNASQMSTEVRNGVTACRWELQLAPRRPETQLPLLFTFEAAETTP
jgi:Tfp pilus assembly protein FimT